MSLLKTLKTLFVPSVSSILASFERTVDKLRIAAERHRDAALSHEVCARSHLELSDRHSDEADHANHVANKIADLID